MSIEHAFGLRDVVTSLMEDELTKATIEDVVEYLESRGLEIDEESIGVLIQFAFHMVADSVSHSAEYFLGDYGMNDLSKTLDELLAMEDSVSNLLDTEDDALQNTAMKQICERCNSYATVEIWCEKHYDQFMREWSCECGEMNGGSINRYQKKCGYCGEARK